MKTLRVIHLAAFLALSPGLGSAAEAAVTGTPTASAEEWAWRATVYGWFPNFKATSTFVLPGGGSIGVDSSPNSYLSNLQFAFMGTLEARKGPWSFVGDAVYVDFGKTKSNLTSITGPNGTMGLPVAANLNADLKGFVGELEVGYSLAQSKNASVDLMAGARYLGLKAGLDFELNGAPSGLPPQGTVEKTKEIWDGVVGLRGKGEFEGDWFVPYYVDIGTGTSRYTWQAFTGVGYHFAWGDAMVGYRHLAYEFKNDNPVSSMTFSGPIVGIGFKF